MVSAKPSVCIFHTGTALPHILLNEGPPQAGGSEVQLSLIARELQRRGWPMTIATCDYGQPAELHTEDGIRIIKASGAKGGLPVVRFFTHTLPADLKALRTADSDIYLEMGISWHTGVLARECLKKGRSFVFWMASISDPWVAVKKRSRLRGHERWLAHRGLKEATAVVAQTREQNRLMQDLYTRDCPVIPNVWPVTNTNGAAPKLREVFWAARYLPLKRPELVLEIARRLPDIQFRMAGGPVKGHEALFEETQQTARSLPNVEIMGFVPFSEIDKYYAQASCYLCTSTIEGFPNTFLQAWNHGTPVVSTFDPDGTLASERVGVACSSIDELAEAVDRMCGEEGQAVGGRARDYLERVHGVDAVIPKVEQILLAAACGNHSST